jgi:uncharacterized repeat protein (TIGR01451 family)
VTPHPVEVEIIKGEPVGSEESGGIVVEEVEAVDDHPIDSTPPEAIFHTLSGDAQTESTLPPFSPRLTIGDRVWRDSNANGLQDAGESGIAFVALELYEGDKLVGATTTDWLGHYTFNVWNVQNGNIDPDDDGLKPNTSYQIRIPLSQSALDDLRLSSANEGSDDARDSDFIGNQSTASLEVVTTTFATSPNFDAGFAPTGSLGSRVWFDANNNQRFDANEVGLAGVTVNLLDESGLTILGTTTTGADGTYSFSGLVPGTYIVKVAVSNLSPGGALAGYSLSTGKPGQVGTAGSLGSLPTAVPTGGGDVSTKNFGFFQSTTLSGRVFVDVNGNGRIDSEDQKGIGGVRIRVSGPAGLFTTVTNADGNYQFANLPAGSYTVTQLPQPAGYRSSTPNFVSTTLTGANPTVVNFGEARALDLRLSQVASRRSTLVGGQIVLTYRIKNIGTLDATNVSLFAPLPASLRFVSAQASGATYDSATGRATIATLAAGAEHVITIRVQTLRAGLNRLLATVQADQSEDNLANNRAMATVVAQLPTPPTKKPTGTNWLLGSKYR